MTDVQVYSGAAVLGAVAGMRSMSSPATIGQLAKSGLLETGHAQLAFLNRPITAKSLAAAAIGELIADKLPFLPKRTKAPSLIWRAVSGALGGAAVCSSKRRSVLAGAMLGAAAAAGATYGAYELRRWAGERFDIPDPVVAIAEDVLVAGCGLLVLSSLRSSNNAA